MGPKIKNRKIAELFVQRFAKSPQDYTRLQMTETTELVYDESGLHIFCTPPSASIVGVRLISGIRMTPTELERS